MDDGCLVNDSRVVDDSGNIMYNCSVVNNIVDNFVGMAIVVVHFEDEITILNIDLA